MKSKSIFALSVVLNLALAVGLVWVFKGKSIAPAEPVVAPPAEPATTPAPATSIVLPAPEQKFNWNTVESEDYKKYIANLRAIGCPEDTLRDIIIADVNKLFESRKQALKSARTNKFEYWKAGRFFSSLADPERIEKNQALAREKNALLKELLGAVPEEKSDLMAAFNPFENMLDFLPEGKQTAVTELYQKYQARMLKALSSGTPDAQDLQQMHQTQKEMDAELGKILTPQEFEDYQLRMSQTAMVMRMQLASFDPSEKEFRAVFQAKKQFEDEFGMAGLVPADAAEKGRMQAAQKQMDEQIKKALGATRYAEYERAQDSDYQAIYRLADRNGLDKQSANAVYEVKQIAEGHANVVLKDTSLSKEQRTIALHSIRAETESALQTVLGDKLFQSYQSQGGYWLKNLSPDSK